MTAFAPKTPAPLTLERWRMTPCVRCGKPVEGPLSPPVPLSHAALMTANLNGRGLVCGAECWYFWTKDLYQRPEELENAERADEK